MYSSMPRLPRVIGVTVTILLVIAGSEGITTEILEPIRSTGEEVGLIFIPGIHIEAEQYTKTARAIQDASQLRIWVALTGSYVFEVADPQQVQEALARAIADLEKAGMVSKNYVGIGHGMGGDSLPANVKKIDLKAIILLSSSLPRESKLRDFPIPVLTLAAELDGLTRITRIANEYEKLSNDVQSGFPNALYRTPVIFIEGANHAQFASGVMPNYIQDGDIAPNSTEEQVHAEIGLHVSSFLTVTFGEDQFQVNDSLGHLADAFAKSAGKFQPFVDVKYLDTDGTTSMWTILAQQYFAGEYGDDIAVYNKIMTNPLFYTQQPRIESSSGLVVLGTATLLHSETKTDVRMYKGERESPLEISMKLVSKDAIWSAIPNKNDTSLRSEPNTCRSLNELALALALSLSSQSIRELYNTQGRPIIFEEDAIRPVNFLWAPTPLKMWEDKAGLHVKAVAMVTSPHSLIDPGVHYCKVMSPYRAMEWVNVDSLREYYG